MNNGQINNEFINDNNAAEPTLYERFQKYWWIIKRKLWLVFLFGILYALYNYNEILKIKEIYASVSTVLLDGSSTDRAVALLGIPGARYGYNNEEYILKSDKLAKKVAYNLLNSFNTKLQTDTLALLRDVRGTIRNIEQIASGVKSAVRFSFDEENNIIRIRATSYDPEEASTIANAYANTYRQYNIEQSRDQILETKAFLRKKIVESQDSLINIEFAVLNFYQKNEFTNYDLSSNNTINQISSLNQKIDELKINQLANSEEIRVIDSTLNKSREDETQYLLNSADNFITYYNEKILELEEDKEEEITKFGAKSDTINSTINVINDRINVYKERYRYYLNQKLENTNLLATVDGTIAKYWVELNARKIELENENQTIPAQINNISKQIELYRETLEIIPFKRLELDKLMRKKRRLESALIRFSERYMDMELAEASEGGYVKLLDAAKPNYYPINKQTTQGVVKGFFYGVLIAIGLIILLDRLDDRIKSDEDLVNFPLDIATGIPSMETVIQKEFQGKKFIDYRDTYISTRLLTTLIPLSGISEMYRRLRSDFLFSMPGKKSKSILITSSNPQEGKSVTCSNLATVLAQSGKKVLLIDADLRRPNIEVLFGLSGQGLTDYIIGNADFDEVIQASVVENLNIIPAGTQVPNPAELLGSDAFNNLYELAMDEFDFVIIDSPPINSVVDAVSIAEKIDMMMIVVRAGKTKKNDLKLTLQILNYVKSKIKGVILNDIHQKSYITDYNYYNNYNYYDNSEPITRVRKPEKSQSLWEKLNA